MQSAKTVLEVLGERGRRGLPIQRIYRQLFNRDLFLLAYQNLYGNRGAMTVGVNEDTADGMSLARIDAIIADLRAERFRFSPARRVMIPKKRGGQRPLGLPTWSDKLVAEVIRLVLEAIWEPTFSRHSHGFRPGRSPHTALSEISDEWKGTRWLIEGDIADCFGSIDHRLLLSLIAERVHDNRFLALIGRLLAAGYLDQFRWHPSERGAPQGSVAAPVFSNILLDRLDRFVVNILTPQYTRGDLRAPNKEYQRLTARMRYAKRHGNREAEQTARQRRSGLPTRVTDDPGYRRLRYVRYCDDFLLGFVGPRKEAEEIKNQIKGFLTGTLGLELSVEKTLITHAVTGKARFLGFDITVAGPADAKATGNNHVVGTVSLLLPGEVIRSLTATVKSRRGRPQARRGWVHLPDHEIIARFESIVRGIVEYYKIASDAWRVGRIRWAFALAMLKTLAAKYRCSLTEITNRYRTRATRADGTSFTCFEAVRLDRRGTIRITRFGGYSLSRMKRPLKIKPAEIDPKRFDRREIVRRLLKGVCELCEDHTGVTVHQVRSLAALEDLPEPRPPWAEAMRKMRRLTLIACPSCH